MSHAVSASAPSAGKSSSHIFPRSGQNGFRPSAMLASCWYLFLARACLTNSGSHNEYTDIKVHLTRSSLPIATPRSEWPSWRERHRQSYNAFIQEMIVHPGSQVFHGFLKIMHACLTVFHEPGWITCSAPPKAYPMI